MADEQPIYPRGRIALGSGDLIEVTNVKVTHTNNAKQVHTMARKGAGITFGVEETSITFDIVISENGPERAWARLVKRGTISQVRIKVPGETMTVNGAFQSRDFELPLDDAIKLTMTFIGAMADE